MSNIIISADLRKEYPVIQQMACQLADLGYASSAHAVINEMQQRHGHEALDALMDERNAEAA